MNLINRLKDLIVGDLIEASNPQPDAADDTAEQKNTDTVDVQKEHSAETVSSAQPKADLKKTTEQHPNKNENYVENKNDALVIVCRHLAKYAYSADKRLARLTLLVVTHNDDMHVDWADSTFVSELKSRLQQEMITAIKQIDVVTVTPDELNEALKRDNRFTPMVDNRLYYKTQPNDQRESNLVDVPSATLECVGGEQYLSTTEFKLNPRENIQWNIGRSTNPTPFETNHIAISDDCLDVSRHQAVIVIDDGKYYLDGRQGGVRMRGGRLTRIIRSNGRKDDITTVAHRSLAPLANDDIIQLSNAVFLKFRI